MKLIDVHSHWGTKRGYPLQSEEERAQLRQTWNAELRYHTEAITPCARSSISATPSTGRSRTRRSSARLSGVLCGSMWIQWPRITSRPNACPDHIELRPRGAA